MVRAGNAADKSGKMGVTGPITRIRLAGLFVLAGLLLASCGSFNRLSPQECMERVMYFESNQSSRDGMIAVGSVVMNRLHSGQYPSSVCGVVGERNQFAPGVLSRRLDSRSLPVLRDAARSVLRGERHPLIGNAMFFHTASYRPRYNNIHYVLVTGGNAFYERRPPALVTRPVPPPPLEGITRR